MQSEGRGLTGRAAEGETRRRLIVTALALERYRMQWGAYPQSLEQLLPELLSLQPNDFMDGKPLRYRRIDDNRFLLYSVGLDCVDDGGRMWVPAGRNTPYFSFDDPGLTGFRRGPDIGWALPASEAEVQKLREQERGVRAEEFARSAEIEAVDQWERTARRQAKVETILKAEKRPSASEPASLLAVLRNEKVSGTNNVSLNELLTLRQIPTGAEPETLTFELPIGYDSLIKIGHLDLYVDPCEDEDCTAEQVECNPGTNGNCLLIWSTIYECPGRHALQAGLTLNDLPRGRTAAATSHLVYNDRREFFGPMLAFEITNLCQFSFSSARFQREFGVNLKAKLSEANGTYLLEIKSPAGQSLRTFSGTPSDGFIDLHWDLKDERGVICTNESFDTLVHITLPDSGRSQVLRGP